MKIIIDATSTQDQSMNRGPGRYTEEVVKNMVKQSLKEGRNDTFYLLLFNSPTTLQPIITECCDNVRSINIGKKRLSDKFNDVWWMFQFKPAIRKLLKEEEPDLYFCPYFWRNFPTKKIPTVVMIHDLTFPLQNKYSMAPRWMDWIRKFQYHKTLNQIRKVEGVLVNSNNTKEDLLKFVEVQPEKINTVYLGISDWVKKVRPRKKVLQKYLTDEVIERGYVFYESGANPSKNIEGLIKSYSELINIYEKKDRKDFPYLVIAGSSFTEKSDPYINQISNLIEDLSLQDKIFFTGYFENEDLSDLISSSELGINLSYYEGFGFGPLQIMKAGIPLIASNVSCYPEVLDGGAELIDPDAHKKIAEKAYEILNNRNKSQELAKRGMEHAKKYIWEKTAKETYEYFVEIIKNSKKGR